MSGQPQTFAVSDPAAAGNNAPFIAATTAPEGFIFRPSAVFPDNGPAQQNVFTHGNSIGTDGLTLLQEMLQGQGLSPSIQLRAATVQVDFSLVANAFSTASLVFAVRTALRGWLFDGNVPTLTLTGGAGTTTGIATIDDLAVVATGAAPIAVDATNPTLTLRGKGSLTNTTGGADFAISVPAAGAFTIFLHDEASIAANAITVGAGATLTVWCHNASTIAASAIGGAGTIAIHVVGSSVSVAGTYQASIVWEGFGGIPTAILELAPGRTENPVKPNVCPTDAEFQAALSKCQGRLLTILDLRDNGSDSYSTAGFIYGNAGLSLEGLFNQSTQLFPTLDVTNAIVGFQFFKNVTIVTSGTDPFLGQLLYFELSGTASLSASANISITVPNGFTSTIDLRDASSLGANAVSIAAGGTLVVNCYDAASIASGAIANSGTLTIHVWSPAVTVDPALVANIVIHYQAPPVATIGTGLTDNPIGATFGTFAALVTYMAQIDSLAGDSRAWTIEVDGTNGTLVVGTGAYGVPAELNFVGIAANSNSVISPTLQWGPGDVTFSGLNQLSFENFQEVSFHNTASPVVLLASGAFFVLEISGETDISNAGSQPVVSVLASTLNVVATGAATFDVGATSTAPIATLDATSNANLFLYDASQLVTANLFTESGGPFMGIQIASSAITIGASYLTAPFTPTIQPAAKLTAYDDSTVPALGATTVQGAIDKIKPSVDFPIVAELTLAQLQALGATASAVVILLALPAPAGTRITQPEIQILQAFAAPGLASASVIMRGTADTAGVGTLVTGANAMVAGNYGLGTNPYPSRAGQGVQYEITLTGATFNQLTAGHIKGRIVDQLSAT